MTHVGFGALCGCSVWLRLVFGCDDVGMSPEVSYFEHNKGCVQRVRVQNAKAALTQVCRFQDMSFYNSSGRHSMTKHLCCC